MVNREMDYGQGSRGRFARKPTQPRQSEQESQQAAGIRSYEQLIPVRTPRH